MFTSKKLTLITIDPIYMKALFDSCNEVFYQPRNYDNKPYLGILIHENRREYAIPLTSAKDKHKTLKIFDKGIVVIHENILLTNLWITWLLLIIWMVLLDIFYLCYAFIR